MSSVTEDRINEAIETHSRHAKIIPGPKIMATIIYKMWWRASKRQLKEKKTDKDFRAMLGALEVFSAHDRKCFKEREEAKAIRIPARPVQISKRLYRLKDIQDSNKLETEIESLAEFLHKRAKKREDRAKDDEARETCPELYREMISLGLIRKS
jgi:hypothetical protein